MHRAPWIYSSALPVRVPLIAMTFANESTFGQRLFFCFVMCCIGIWYDRNSNPFNFVLNFYFFLLKRGYLGIPRRGYDLPSSEMRTNIKILHVKFDSNGKHRPDYDSIVMRHVSNTSCVLLLNFL